jgi:hypothetical protein
MIADSVRLIRDAHHPRFLFLRILPLEVEFGGKPLVLFVVHVRRKSGRRKEAQQGR